MQRFIADIHMVVYLWFEFCIFQTTTFAIMFVVLAMVMYEIMW